MKIQDFEKDLVVDKTIEKEGYDFFHFESEPFKLYGGIKRGENGMFYRVPPEVADRCNKSVQNRCTDTSGARIKFRTNSQRFAVVATYHKASIFAHFPMTATVGLDLYADGVYSGTFLPPSKLPNLAFEAEISLVGEQKEREILINLPL